MKNNLIFLLITIFVTFEGRAQSRPSKEVALAQIGSLLSASNSQLITTARIQQAFSKAIDCDSAFINIDCFGAIPNDNIDDTDALLAAVAASNGEAIVFPTGQYDFENTITIAKSNVRLIGMGNAVLNFKPATSKKALVMQGFDNRIQGLHFISNANVTTQIEFAGNGSRCSITQCIIEGHSSKPSNSIGIHLNGATPAVYLFTMSNNSVLYYGIGTKLSGEAQGHFIGNNYHQSIIGMEVANQGGLCTFSNLFFQTVDSCAIKAVGGMNTYMGVRCESNTGPTIKFMSGSNFNHYYGLQNTGSGGEVLDLGTQNFGLDNMALNIGYLHMPPVYDIYVKSGSLFRDLGNANKLSYKKGDGTVIVIE